MIRTAISIFAMLRYRSRWKNQLSGSKYVRPLLIAFEEPEIYLHPQTAKQMRDTIYQLARSQNNQIICTPHSLYMIDLSKNTHQILNALYLEQGKVDHHGSEHLIEKVCCSAFNIS